MESFEILFVCQANIGRSQMAEAFFNHYVPGHKAYSAGVDDFGAKYNYTPTGEIIETMKEVGIDISRQRIKHITKEMVDSAKKVYVFCDPTVCNSYPDYLVNNQKVELHIIEDPHEKASGTIKNIRDKIKEFVQSIY